MGVPLILAMQSNSHHVFTHLPPLCVNGCGTSLVSCVTRCCRKSTNTGKLTRHLLRLLELDDLHQNFVKFSIKGNKSRKMVTVKGVILNVKSINIKRMFSMEKLHSHLIKASPCNGYERHKTTCNSAIVSA